MKAVRYVMTRRPVGAPLPEDFGRTETDLPPPGPGELLVRAETISLDPYIRLRMAGRHLVGNLSPGDPISSEAICVVEASNAPGFAAGDKVAAFIPWQTHAIVSAAEARPVSFGDLPASLGLGVLGMPGLTAYAGVNTLLKPRPGETMVVSAASGPVGGTVGQLAKAAGARVIGIAGGPEKCAWVKAAGFDDCIDYRAHEPAAALKALCPNGVEGYFDNIGGELLRAMLTALKPGGRVVLCGIVADYNDEAEAPGPTPLEIITARAHVMGLVVYDHENLRPEWENLGAQMIRDGRLAYREDITQGLDNAPAAFARLMRGGNQGKALVAV